MTKHNKELPYLLEAPLQGIYTLEDFDKATRAADGRIICIIYYSQKKEAFKAFETMKSEYLNLDFFAVSELRVQNEFKDKFMKKEEKFPYFRFYKDGEEIDFVRH